MPVQHTKYQELKHEWNISIRDAMQLQKRMSSMVIEDSTEISVKYIAGCDLAFEKKRGMAFGALVLLEHPSLELVERHTIAMPVDFPYIPGLLSFREGPVLMKLFSGLERSPDLILFDGQGLAHPRGLGVASHVGLLLGIPSIGVAKSRLFGHAKQPGSEKGNMENLLDPNGRIIGRVLRSRDNVRPLYISIGHMIDLDSACRWTLDCTTRYRLPEPTRQADKLAAISKKDWLAEN